MLSDRLFSAGVLLLLLAMHYVAGCGETSNLGLEQSGMQEISSNHRQETNRLSILRYYYITNIITVELLYIVLSRLKTYGSGYPFPVSEDIEGLTVGDWFLTKESVSRFALVVPRSIRTIGCCCCPQPARSQP